jgi:hypothetical protein
MAGYSPRSLVQKLGIKAGDRVLWVQAPAGYGKILGPLPEVSVSSCAAPADAKALAKKAGSKKIPFDFIQAFFRDEAELQETFPALKGMLAGDGMLWISWPKGKSAKPSKSAGSGAAPRPFNETRVREIGLAGGLVDVKVCAVDETWSGLKFMFRLRDRQ